MIINKDCLEALKELPDNSIDAIVTDPPYHLVSVTKRFGGKNAHNTPAMETEEGGVFARKAKGFMGKDWDGVDETGLGIAQKVELWEECLRVLKPGGYLLAFSGTRTTHRMTVAIEDAGFEVRDMIAWVYGSGFPKSLNIGKAVDKLQGNEREVVGTREVPDITGDAYGTMNEKQGGSYEAKTIQDTKGTSEWEGWGTALKPALEPITVARKPIEGTVAENCLKWGVGGINIDGCRVGFEKIVINGGGGGEGTGWGKKEEINEERTGRFPANLIHDGSEEVLELFPSPHGAGSKRGSGQVKHGEHTSLFGIDGHDSNGMRFGDSGSAARFFYCAKASKSERNMGLDGFEEKEGINGNKWTDQDYRRGDEKPTTKRQNFHPTVKPIKLMEYLVNLVSKEGHTVLDPFCGSGTTGIACKKLDRNFIGIERDEEYCKIATARIESVSQNNTLFV